MISIWEAETFFAPQDIIIAGSGFVGLWSAFYLKKKAPHLRITILERGLIPTGASTRNAGFACFGSLSELMYDSVQMGTDAMLELVEMRFKGLERIQKYFGTAPIDFEQCGGYELYPTGTSVEQLQEDTRYINALLSGITGSRNLFKFADEAITAFDFGGTAHLIKNKYEGYLHSGKLLKALLQQVQGMGVQVFNGIELKDFEKNGNGFSLNSTGGLTFTANRILICTNAFAKSLIPDADIIPARGQILLTSPIEGLTLKGTFHSDEGFYYFRNLGNRVLLGGARHKAFEEEQTHDFNTTLFIQQELEHYLAEIILPKYKDRYTIEQRWSGIMAMGSEKAPIIKEVAPGVYVAVRMSGMGVALAPVAAQKISKMMLV